MKKWLSYIVLSIVVLAALVLLLTGSNSSVHTFDGRISFRKRDKIPYGTYVAYQNLKNIFPNASVIVNNKEPGYWDSLSRYDKGQALLIVCPEFKADAAEMKTLVSFAENGNDVFISAMDISYEVTEMLNCDVFSYGQLMRYLGISNEFDTLTVALAQPPFAPAIYTYPGKRYDGYFSKIDTTITTVMGYNQAGNPNFIRLRAGKGNLYVHLAPITFSNYFLLHGNNFPYYENILSVIPATTTKIAWDEFYLYKKQKNKNEQKNWLVTLLGLKNPDGKKPFAIAFWILLSLILL